MKLPQPVLSAITAVLIFQIVSKAAEPIPDALIWTVYPGTTTEQPNTFNSLEAAIHSLRQKKRESGGRLQQPIEVRVMPGEYFLDVPLTFKPEDSGTAECPVTFRAWGTGPVVISGGVPIEHWSRTEWNDRPALVADLPRMNGVPLNFQQLWINGRRATLARSPNQGYLKLERAIDPPEVDATSRTGTREFTYKEEDTRYWKDVNSGTAVVFNRWMENRMPLYAIYPTNRQVQCDRPSLWQLEADDSYYLEGGPSMLDTPGEWWPDIENDKLYYLPLPGETTVRGVAPALHQILRLEGRPREDRY
ncbi:MAG: hypothetical protein KJT03_04340, partial [Verrucomicrobiae bacterium]|nr:hypothetical protein [Verrucomicrobiae bacterium]